MTPLPTGTVTFLFTDIEGSTKLARDHPEAWESMRLRHDGILRTAVESNNGFVFHMLGDSLFSAFHTPGDALRAAIKAQQDLQNESWQEGAIRVRMGIHTGEAERVGKDYHGYLAMSLVQRVMSAGHGGQILISNTTRDLLWEQLHPDISLHDLGEHRLKDAPHPVRVFQVVAPGLQREFPALRALDAFRNNLPTQLTSFIGREKEVEEVKCLIQERRLLTLTGAGGTGKTRLALQVAAGIVDRFRDGLWFVELASISDAALVPGTVAGVLRVPEQPGRPILTTLIDWLAERELMLILDNCEHLIEACAQLVDSVLHACLGVRILATGREALGVPGETTYYVPSLPTPDAACQLSLQQLGEYDSLRLFVERAAQMLPGFALTDARLGAVAQICRRLDGIPLAIELAAARVRVLPVEEIAKRLDNSFRLLTGGSRTALPRHQTLRSLIDWSHSLLSGPEKLLLRRLSVFTGGWTLEAAESVCSLTGIEPLDVLDLLSHLVDKSLVLVDVQAGTARYHMLETIRQYAREKLFESGEGETIRKRHFDHYRALAAQFGTEQRRQNQVDWMRRIAAERDNYRAALDWCLDAGEADMALHLTLSFGRDLAFTYFLPLSEGRDRLERILAAVPDPTLERAQGLCRLGLIVHAQGDYSYSQALLEQALALAEALGDRYWTARAAFHLSWPLLSLGKQEQAVQLMERSLALFREECRPEDEAFVLSVMGEEARMKAEWLHARELGEQALELLRPLNERTRQTTVLGNLGMVLIHFNEFDQSRALLKETLLMAREIESRNVDYVLMGFAWLANATGQPIRAVRLLGASSALRKAEGQVVDPGDRPDYESNLASLHAQLDDATFEKEWQRGAAMTSDQAIDYALAEEGQ